MGLNCGIVGLPNVGKSTIFRALTSAKAETANYPFCTIAPNVGMAPVKDPRLHKLAQIISPQRVVPSIVEFVDIAGLVKGASRGEGLGNQFLGHIRQVHAIIHVVRCFHDDEVAHVHAKVAPSDDILTVNTELALADLATVESKLQALPKLIKDHNKDTSRKAKRLWPILERLQEQLGLGNPARSAELDQEEKELVQELHLMTQKATLYLCNVDEEGINQDSSYVQEVRQWAQREGAKVLKVCGKLESDIADLEDEEEKREFLETANIEKSGLEKLTEMAYQLLGQQTFFTAGPKEIRAWTFRAGSKAPQAAGAIHTDFERGFIRAEVYHCEELFKLGSEQKIKEMGQLRLEGKDYLVQDGDVMHFRFNV